MGRNIALALAHAGARVALAARTPSELEAVRQEVYATASEGLCVPTDMAVDELKVEVPRGSGNWLNLDQAARDLSSRLARIFLYGPRNGGRRPVFGDEAYFLGDSHWRDYLPFHEYSHGDSGARMGASHQTGWTALVAKLIQDIKKPKGFP